MENAFSTKRPTAIAAASSLFGAPNLRRMCETWTLAVLTLMTSVVAIWRSARSPRSM
jgi:hypothetical protein